MPNGVEAARDLIVQFFREDGFHDVHFDGVSL